MTGPFRAATRIFLCEYNCKIPFSRFQHGCRNPSHSLPAIRGCARNRPQISLSNICIGRDCRRRRWSTLDICTTVFYLLNIPSAPRKSMWLTRRTSFLGLDKFEYKDTTRHCYFMLRQDENVPCQTVTRTSSLASISLKEVASTSQSYHSEGLKSAVLRRNFNADSRTFRSQCVECLWAVESDRSDSVGYVNSYGGHGCVVQAMLLGQFWVIILLRWGERGSSIAGSKTPGVPAHGIQEQALTVSDSEMIRALWHMN